MKKINKGEVFVVRHIIGETARPFIQKQKEGNNRYIAKKAIICEGEETKDGFFHLRQAIPHVEEKEVVKDSVDWPRLRMALNNDGREPINIPGGDDPLHYEDCVAVRDFKMRGSHYFIVPKKEIGSLLDGLPLDDKGKDRKKEIEKRKERRKMNKDFMLVNLTPHAITFFSEDETPLFTVEPSGQLARAVAKTVRTGTNYLTMVDGVCKCIPETITEYGDIEGLPDPEDGVAYIVSSIVASAVKGREDVFIPNESVRDNEGRINGCKSLGKV